MNNSTLFDLFIQWMSVSTGLILIGGIIAQGVFRKSAVWRHHIWLRILAAVLLVPSLTWLYSILNMGTVITWDRFVPQSAEQNLSQTATTADKEILALTTTSTTSIIQTKAPTVTGRTNNAHQSDLLVQPHSSTWIPKPEVQAMILWIWEAGSILLALRWIVGARRLASIVNQSTHVTNRRERDALHRVSDASGLGRMPELRQSLSIRTPMVVGTWNPCILLPDTETLQETELQQILEHECAHIKRLDSWIWTLQRIGRLVFWINPLFHWLHTELNRAREELCDNHVLKTWSGLEYAKALSRISKIWTTPNVIQDGLAIGFRKHQLVQRVESILDESVDHRMGLRSKGRFFSATFIGVLTLTSITVVSGLYVDTPRITSAKEAQHDGQVLQSSQQIAPVVPKLYPANLEPYMHEHILGRKLEIYPWVEESDYHRISRDLLEWPAMQVFSISLRGTNGVLVSKEFAKAFGLSIEQVAEVNQVLADDFHQLSLLEFSGLIKQAENHPQNIQTGGLVKKIMEAHTFVRSSSSDQEKVDAIRADTKTRMETIIGKERSDIFWQGSLPFNMPLFSKYFTFRLEDLGTQLEIGLHRASGRGSMNGRPLPHEWDHYAPAMMQPILSRWRSLVRESLNDDDEPILIFHDEVPEDYSELTASGVVWTDHASFVDLPKSTISTLGLSGLDIFQRISLDAIALAGLTEEDVNFVTAQYGDFENRFQALEKLHFHPIEHPEYNYQLDSFPEEADKLKSQWMDVLIETFGQFRGKMINDLMRTRLSFIQQEQLRMKELEKDPSNELLLLRPMLHHLWVNEGNKTFRVKFTKLGDDRCELKYVNSKNVQGSMTGSIDRLPQPFKHLLYPKFAAPPEGAF